MQHYLISLLIFTPVVFGLIVLFLPRSTFARALAIGASAVQCLLLVIMIALFDATGEVQFVEQQRWINIDLGSWGVLRSSYFVGVDGLSMPLVALSVVIMLIAILASNKDEKDAKGYYTLMLILNAAIIGSFTALDLLVFYLFFEFMLLPMFFLIGIWGGARREYASIKFFLYTLLGSIFILIAFIGLYLSFADQSPENGQLVHTFNMLSMQDPSNIVSRSIFDPYNVWVVAGQSARTWAFILLFVGFAIKLPMVPLHTWLPDAHVEASTPVSVVLAALLLKIGGYGIMRIAYPIFPDSAVELSWFVALMGVISIIYGAFNAMASKDLKRLIAYSSVSHMGFVLLGLASVTSEGVTGAVYQMFSHGLITSMLFILAGVLGYRTNDRIISHYSGLYTRMPSYFVFVLIAFFAGMGLPGFSGFIAEITVLLGAFRSGSANGLLHESLAIIATFGLVLSAAYFLWAIQRMFFGKFNAPVPAQSLYDLQRKELLVLIPLAVATLIFGIFPQPVLNWINPFARSFVTHVIETGNLIIAIP